MNHKFRMIILVEDEIRLLTRIIILLSRRNLKINYINVSTKNESNYTNQYILDVECSLNKLIKIKKIIKKIIGIIYINLYEIKKNNSYYKLNINMSNF
ncbi:acetolactate synthase [Blattabacterium cuenoti]|uniref:acetolactate synthase n=1 Tax=Blattabacterium cuenoti TaxID=1653831 RepID=UPI00163CFE80|nr:acetolactate synthase [Blattabacterium cuenoti]